MWLNDTEEAELIGKFWSKDNFQYWCETHNRYPNKTMRRIFNENVVGRPVNENTSFNDVLFCFTHGTAY